MTLQNLLNYVEDNATSLDDKIKVASIKAMKPGDPWQRQLIRDLRAKYGDLSQEAELAAFFDEVMNG